MSDDTSDEFTIPAQPKGDPPGAGDWPFIDERELVQASLDQRFAVKTGSDWNMWTREEWPEQAAHDKRWPVRLMELGQPGDELWWYESSPKTWEHLCGRAGWALVRAGQVVDTELVLMN